MVRSLALVVALSLGAVARPAAAQDVRARAAEHFALAQSAERRADYRAAIREYGEAYRLAPHPSVLFNLGVNHERLGEHRQACRFFLRYVDGAPDADDRDEVLAKVARLRGARSQVAFTSRPPGARVLVDGAPVGVAPVEVALPSGRHQIVAELDGRRSSARPIVLEYGERLEVELDLAARPGILQVDSNVAGAEVVVDGAVIGMTPFVGAAVSGGHQLEVRRDGYQPAVRRIEVPAEGHAQYRVDLTLLPGAEDPAAPRSGLKVLLGSSYGVARGEEASEVRYTVDLGLRTPGDRFELSGGLGNFGTALGGGGWAGARVFLLTGGLRPYLRAGAIFADRMAGEGGVGVTLASSLGPNVGFAIEYYAELAFQLRADVEPVEDVFGEMVDSPNTSVPLLFGLALRFGR